MAIRRSQAEREFYYRRLGGSNPQQTLQQLERSFYINYLESHGKTVPHFMPIRSLFTMWAKQYISDAGHTPPPGPINYPAQLWRQLVVCLNLGLFVSKNQNDNKNTFYLNAP
jgi:hypothetical protein